MEGSIPNQVMLQLTKPIEWDRLRFLCSSASEVSVSPFQVRDLCLFRVPLPFRIDGRSRLQLIHHDTVEVAITIKFISGVSVIAHCAVLFVLVSNANLTSINFASFASTLPPNALSFCWLEFCVNCLQVAVRLFYVERFVSNDEVVENYVRLLPPVLSLFRLSHHGIREDVSLRHVRQIAVGFVEKRTNSEFPRLSTIFQACLLKYRIYHAIRRRTFCLFCYFFVNRKFCEKTGHACTSKPACSITESTPCKTLTHFLSIFVSFYFFVKEKFWQAGFDVQACPSFCSFFLPTRYKQRCGQV